MDETTPSAESPFWLRKRLDELSDDEWDSLCDRCGRCCLDALRADDTSEVFILDVGCSLQDPVTGGCSNYANRKSIVPNCGQLTPDNVGSVDRLPSTCGYVRVHRGQDLEPWHPLVSGRLESVNAAGMSVAGRFIERRFAGIREYHIVDWPKLPATSNPRDSWHKAMFGGVNASVPTPFDPDNRVDIALMAEHCFWLLSNGCHGLMVLDTEGEVAALTIAERIAILEGLASHGVPTSKILAGIGPASVADAGRIAIRANDLGIRGVVASVPVGVRVLPQDVISQNLRAVLASLPERLHVYLSFAPGQGAASACLTAIAALLSDTPGRLRGIRDESPGCGLGLAALERFGPTFEVYVADPAILRAVIQRGAAGLIGPGANLLGLHCRALLGGAKPEYVPAIQQAIQSVGQILRARRPVLAIKSLLARQSGNVTWERVRLPLRPTGANQRMALFQAFDACGVRLRPAERAVT